MIQQFLKPKSNHDRLNVNFHKGELRLIAEAAKASGKGVNEYITGLVRNETNTLLEDRLSEVKGYWLLAETVPCKAKNILLYIDSTDGVAGYPNEPLRIMVIDLDHGTVLYRKEFTTIISDEGNYIYPGACVVTEKDIGKIKGYLECDNVYTYDLERIKVLSDTWNLAWYCDHVKELNGFSDSLPLNEAIGLNTDERKADIIELVNKLTSYARNCLIKQ